MFLPVSAFSVFLFTYVYLDMFHRSIPEYEEGYGRTVSAAITNGDLFYAVITIGFASAALAYPILYICLSEMKLIRGLLIVWACVLTEIVVVTPFSRLLGWLLAYVVFILALAGYKKWGPPRRTHLPAADDI